MTDARGDDSKWEEGSLGRRTPVECCQEMFAHGSMRTEDRERKGTKYFFNLDICALIPY